MRILILPGRVVLIAVALGLGASACGGEDGETEYSPPVYSEESLGVTGLFTDLVRETLEDGVLPFQPRWELWSDGADKRRWLEVPAGSSIDASNPDEWVFPVGTKAWKEFTRDGIRIETRMLEKTSSSNWDMVSYVWNGNRTDALLTTSGLANALGTDHDVPSGDDCKSCHEGMKDKLLGVSALQLDHAESGFDLGTLGLGGHALPGDGVAASALGVLHANCGGCHAGGPDQPLDLRLAVGELSTVESTATFRTTVSVTSNAQKQPAGIEAQHIVEPGSPEQSILHLRMTRRGGGFDGGQMPWLGTEVVDAEGAASVAAWIRAL